MTELSTHTRKELAHRSSDDMDVTLIWVLNDGEDEGRRLRLRQARGRVLRDPDQAVPRPRCLLPPLRVPQLQHRRLRRQSHRGVAR